MPVDDEGPDRGRSAPRARGRRRRGRGDQPGAEPDRGGGLRRTGPTALRARARRPRPSVLVIEDDHAAELARGAAGPAGRRRPAVGVRPVGLQAVRTGPAGRRRGRRRGEHRPGRGPDAARRRLGVHRAAAAGGRAVAGRRRSRAVVDRARVEYARRRDGAAGRAAPPRAWRRAAVPASTSGCRRRTSRRRWPRCASGAGPSRPVRCTGSPRRPGCGSR